MMRAIAAVLLTLAAPATAQRRDQASLDEATRGRVEQAVTDSGFVGTFAVYAGPRRIAAGSAGQAIEGQPGGFDYAAVWPWGDAVTGQVAGVLAMQEVEAGRLGLDAVRGAITRNDVSALVGVLERGTRTSFPDLFAQRIAAPLGLTAGTVGTNRGVDAGWAGGPDPDERRASASRLLEGTAVDLATIDRALLSGALLSKNARADLWRFDPDATRVVLRGCAEPRQVVERRGSVGRFATLNLILPAQGISVVLFSNRGSGAVGSVSAARGAARAIAGAAACA